MGQGEARIGYRTVVCGIIVSVFHDRCDEYLYLVVVCFRPGLRRKRDTALDSKADGYSGDTATRFATACTVYPGCAGIAFSGLPHETSRTAGVGTIMTIIVSSLLDRQSTRLNSSH